MDIRPANRPACLILALLLCSCGTDELPAPPPALERPIAAGQVLRLMSYNIHHANPPLRPGVIDVDAIAAVIHQAQPDLVALQEVDVNTGRSGAGLDQAQALAQKTGMQAFFGKSIDYDGGQYGNAMLSRLPFVESQAYALPVGPEGGEVRSVARIALATGEGGRLHFASTHLENERAGTRDLQAAVLLEIERAIGAPLVLAGDFNAERGSSAIGLIEQRFVAACGGECPPTSPARLPRNAIDLVFLSAPAAAELTVLSYRVVREPRASDHRPVVVELRYR